MKCRYFCRLPLDISPVYLTRGISQLFAGQHGYANGAANATVPIPQAAGALWHPLPKFSCPPTYLRDKVHGEWCGHQEPQ